jgi:curved DNA-binding protein CbpA
MLGEAALLTAYQLLGVDPCAPGDLVGAAYWMAVAELQPRRTADPEVDATLHAVTRAYETLSDHEKRAAYDASIGFTGTPVMTRRLPRQDRSLLRAILRRPPGSGGGIDYYEIIGLDPGVSPERIPQAYAIMRDYYLRAPDGRRRKRLIGWLDEAYSALTDAARRRQYDEERARTGKHRLPPAPSERSAARRPGREKPVPLASSDVAEKTAAGALPAALAPGKMRPQPGQSELSPGGAAVTSRAMESSSRPAGNVDGARTRAPEEDNWAPARAPGPAAVEPLAADRPARRAFFRGLAVAAPAIRRTVSVAAAAARSAIRITARGVDSGFRRLLAVRRSSGGAAGRSPGPESMPKSSARQRADVEEALLDRLASTVRQTEPAPDEGERHH